MFVLVFSLTACKIPPDFNKSVAVETGSAQGKINMDDVMDRGPVKGGTLNIFSTPPDTLNPLLTSNAYVQDFTNLIFESLVKLDRDQKPIPLLCDRWEISDDRLVWTFHIRNNVTWHDGLPLTSEDVEFTAATVLNPAVNSVYKKNLQNVTTFAAIDRYNFRVVLKKPNSFTAETMTFPIIPKHYFLGEDISKTPRNMKPIGSGPYKFVSNSGKNIILNINENWWKSGEAGGNKAKTPYISEIDVKIYDNQADALAAFQSRDIDVSLVNAGDCSKYSSRSDSTIKKYTGRDYEFIAFNLTRPVFADKAVRQAVASALDKMKIIESLLPGEAVAADIPVIPDTWLYDTDIVSINRDAAKSREILKNDGWKESANGLYKYINGIYTPLEFELLINSENSTRSKVAEMVRDQLAEAGIKIKINSVNWDDEFKSLYGKKFDMALLGFNVPQSPDISFAYATSEIASGTNVAGYSNPDVDNYLQQILSENDQARRKTLFYKMRQVINDDTPYIGLYFYNNAVLYNKRVRGGLDPYVWDKFNDIAAWYIPIK